MSKQAITYSEKCLNGQVKYYGIVYLKNGHTFYTRAFNNRSSARNEALRQTRIHG